MNDPGEVKRRYRQFADRECRGYSEAYDRLALAVSEDDEVAGFIAAMPVTQPNLFLASVQLLTGHDAMPKTGPELRAFVKRRGAEVGDVMQSHRTQTNEVGRCAVLLPALPSGPLALVEVGASAGLCLLLDQFHYEFGSTSLGAASSPVHLRCALAGPVPLPAAMPHIVWRHGLDRHPIDVHDDDAVRWLLACVWPDHPERRRRLEGAIALARLEPPVVSAGDLVDDLPRYWPRFRRMPSSSSSTRRSSATRVWTIGGRLPPSWPMRRGGETLCGCRMRGRGSFAKSRFWRLRSGSFASCWGARASRTGGDRTSSSPCPTLMGRNSHGYE